MFVLINLSVVVMFLLLNLFVVVMFVLVNPLILVTLIIVNLFVLATLIIVNLFVLVMLIIVNLFVLVMLIIVNLFVLATLIIVNLLVLVVRSKPVCIRNVCKSKQAVQNVYSNKVVFPVDVGEPHCENNSMILPAECCIYYLKFLLLLFLLPIFLVSMMSSTFHVSILNLDIIMNVHMTFLISTKLFKCKYTFETLFKILSKVFYRHLYIYLITINLLIFAYFLILPTQ